MIKWYKVIVWRISGRLSRLGIRKKLEHEKMVIWARTVMKIDRSGWTSQTLKKHLQASVIG